QDAFNNTNGSYSGTVSLSSTDGQFIAPAAQALVAGTTTFSSNVILKTASTPTVSATDGVNSGTSSNITVNPAAASKYQLTVITTQIAGNPFNLTVTAQDPFNNTATGYTGTVTFSKSDAGAGSALPANYTFVLGDAGVHSFTNGITLVTTPSPTVTATDTVTGSITKTANITGNPAAASHYSVSAPASSTAGIAFTTTVTALDAFNNTATGYTGTAHFTSTDGLAVLPSNYTFLVGDAGVHSFINGVTLKTAGGRTITGTDTINGSINGTSSAVTVSAAAATHFSMTAPITATAGTAFTVTVTALDQFNNTATGYTGQVLFTSTDVSATLPGNYTFVGGDAGVHSFSNGVTLRASGGRTVTATYTVTGTITGTSGSITVLSATATHYTFCAPARPTAGTSFS